MRAEKANRLDWRIPVLCRLRLRIGILHLLEVYHLIFKARKEGKRARIGVQVRVSAFRLLSSFFEGGARKGR